VKRKGREKLTRERSRGIIATEIGRRRSCTGSTAPVRWPSTQTTTPQPPYTGIETDTSSEIENTKSLIATRLRRNWFSIWEEEREAPVARAPNQHSSLLNFMSLAPCVVYPSSPFACLARFFSFLYFSLKTEWRISCCCRADVFRFVWLGMSGCGSFASEYEPLIGSKMDPKYNLSHVITLHKIK
jgi:hypothetical protein